MQISQRDLQNKVHSESELYEDELIFIDKAMVGLYLAIFFKRKIANQIKKNSF